ncbi:MAG: YiiG family protein [Acidobacteria bacterium]|nr:YiiG family protein [Acidobacteriota bacterium]
MQQRMMSRTYTTLILIALILGSTLGCARISELVKKGRGEDPPVPPPTRDYPGSTPVGDTSDDDNNIVKKTNYYITDCYNRYSNRIVDSHNRYLSWVKSAEQGPTGKESIVYGLYDVNGDGSDCEKAVASAKGIEPMMPELDEAADNYVVALKEVITAIRGIYQYYEQDDYKDDNFAKGKAAHAGLMDAFKKFKDVNTVFAAQVDKLEDDVAEKELARLSDDGKTYEAVVVETGIKAKKIKNLLQAKEFDQITVDDLSPLIDDFSTTVDKMKASNAKPMTSMYTNSCDSFLKASKEMMRRIRDKKPFTDFEKRQIAMGFEETIEGSPGKVIGAYNDMIRDRHFTRF